MMHAINQSDNCCSFDLRNQFADSSFNATVEEYFPRQLPPKSWSIPVAALAVLKRERDESMDGQEYKLSDFRGTKVMLCFYKLHIVKSVHVE